MSDLTLRVEGEEVKGWTATQIVRSLDDIASSFDLQIASKNTNTPPPAALVGGAFVEILYGEKLVLSGYIDVFNASYASASTTLSVNGRSKAGDLVDCTSIKPGKKTGGSWRKTLGLTIAQDICDPFGIEVSSDVGPLPKESYFKLEEGESCFSALDRMAKDYGLRLRSDPDGSIVFTKAGLNILSDVVIETAKNVLAGGISVDMTERFSDYLFKGQRAATKDTNGSAVNSSHLIQDEGVARYRPLVLEKDRLVKQRAEWERNVRAGKSFQLSYDVINPDDVSLSWEMGSHGLWEPGAVVTVIDPFLGINDLFIVTNATLVRDDAGTRTSLKLSFPDAYQAAPPKKKKKKAGYTW
jgi:prophage tail gpP-like protein